MTHDRRKYTLYAVRRVFLAYKILAWTTVSLAYLRTVYNTNLPYLEHSANHQKAKQQRPKAEAPAAEVMGQDPLSETQPRLDSCALICSSLGHHDTAALAFLTCLLRLTSYRDHYRDTSGKAS